jgi:hypothetical protein
MTRALRALLVLLVCLGGALTLAPASYADRTVHRDARHDVMRTGGPRDEELVPAPRASEFDVVRTLVTHRRHDVEIKLRFAELQRHAMRMEFATIRTGRQPGDNYALTLVVAPGMIAVQLTNATGPARCWDMGYRINFRRNTISMSVPRSCLGNPRWIRAGVGAIGFNGSLFFKKGDNHLYFDDAMNDGFAGFDSRLRMTRKLYRD